MNQKFTVLGSEGFIGRRLAEHLRRSDSNLWTPRRGSDEVFTRSLGVVYYCIGLTADYASRPFDTIQAHVSYLAQILERAQFDHIVYLSSTRLYDGLDIELGRGDMPLRLSPNNPRHLYDLSKALGENLCMTTAGERCSIARLSSVFDPEPGAPGFLSELMQRVRHERAFTLNSKPGYCRDYITLDDTVASLIAIGNERVCDIINVASGVNTYNSEIADTLRPLGIDIRFDSDEQLMKLPRCDIQNLRSLGVSPANTLRTLETFVRNLTV